MKQSMFKPCLFTLAAILSLVACKKDPVETPELPSAQYQLRQIKWSETDYLSIQYNEKKQPSLLHNQWQFLEGDPTKIQTIEDVFQYDGQGRLTRIQTTGDFVTQYFYTGNRIEQTREMKSGGVILSENSYFYDDNHLVSQVKSIPNAPGEAPTVYLYQFAYDSEGNMNKVDIFIQLANPTPEKSFELLNTTEYGDFDDKINPASWLLHYPYLPQIIFQHNNPRKEVYRTANGEAQTTTYEYEYDERGLPVVKRRFRNGGVVSAIYQY